MSYSLNVPYLAHWGWGAAVQPGHRRREQEDAAGPGLGGGSVPVVKAREGGPESPLWHTIVLGRRVQAVQAC